MRSQTDVSYAKILEQVRGHGTIEVIEGAGFEQDLARQLDLPEFQPDELATAVEELVDEGKLASKNTLSDLGQGGIGKEQVSERVIRFSIP